MAVWTNVSDDVLEPGDPIRSVDIIAIKENVVFTNSFNDVQTFNSSGTWTKPNVDGVPLGSMARIQVWGGGGGGSQIAASATSIAGAGGGGYNEVTLPLTALDATVVVTVGAGGIGRTGSEGVGTKGGTTTFGSVLGAAGAVGAILGTSTSFAGSALLADLTELPAPGSIDGLVAGGTGTRNAEIISSSYSIYGGGGGAGCVTSTPGIGAKSVHGGFGGNGATSGTAGSGTAPGGGGGSGNAGANGGNGGAGRVVVTVW